MATLTLAQAANISQDLLIQGIIQEFITPDDFAKVLPFKPVEGGKALVYARELTDPKTTVGYLDVAGTPTASAPTYTQITASLGRIGGDAEIDNFEQVTMSKENDIRATQIASKSRGMSRKWREGVILGSGTFPEFSGINTLVDSTNMWIAAAATTQGGTISFALMDQLVDLVTADGDMFIIMDKVIRRRYKALLRALSITPDYVELGWLNPLTGERALTKVMAYEGVPIFRNDNVAAESTYGVTGKYRITCGTFGEKTGLTGIMPADSDPGIRVYPIGQKDAKPADAVRLEMYTGLALYSTKALGQLVNLRDG